MLIDLATHGLLTNGLNHESVVIDLGANAGDFARAVSSRFGCKVVAVEPSIDHAKRLGGMPGVQVVCAAVGAEDGATDFHVCGNSQMSSIVPLAGVAYERTQRVRVMSFETLLRELSLDRVDVLKIDIEGSETALLQGMSDVRLGSIAQVTIELHDFNGMISSTDADRIEQRLIRLGFHRIQLSRTNRENVLYFQPGRCGVSRARELWDRVVRRNLIGIRRMRARQSGIGNPVAPRLV